MLNGKTVSIKRVIENLYRDYKFTTELSVPDAIEWIADAIDRIGVNMAYKARVACISITNHRGYLPCDLHHIEMVREDDSKLPMVYASDRFHVHYACDDEETASTSCATGNCITRDIDDTGSTDPDDNTHCNPFFNFNPNPDTTQLVTTDVNSEMLTYIVNNNYIFTGFQNGCVEMAYWAYPLDTNGLPEIPDDTRTIDAIVKYVAMKIFYQMVIRGKMPPALLEKAEQDWYWAVGNARCHALMPSIDKFEAIKNSWIKLIPNVIQHSFNFKYLCIPESRHVKSV